MKRLALTVMLAASLAPAAHAQYGWESMMPSAPMMNPGMMMNPMTMMMPMTMMGAPMMMGGMGNPMTMMMPMTMMGAPMMMGGMGNPMAMMGTMAPQQYLGTPYLNPMGTANPYLAPQSPQGFFPMMPVTPAAPAYGMPGYYPPAATPQTGTMPFDPSAWMPMFNMPAQAAQPAAK